MSHYFTDNTEMHHNRKEISFRFLGIFYSFVTDAGVFSRDQVDYGSQVLIKTVLKNGIEGNKILDLGCGYGAISIVLQKATGKEVVALDVNPRAIELTKENSLKNNTEIRAYTCDVIGIEETFDTIVTNPPIRAGKETVYRFFSESYDHLDKDGVLWVVIRKQQGADSARTRLKEIFGNCEIREREKGYYILYCKKV